MTLFVRLNMNLTERISDVKQLRKISNQYEALVCGSDQIWSFDDSSFRNFDSSYFLDFTEPAYSGIKISYAPSCGNTKTFGVYGEKIGQLLRNFDGISVRDSYSSKLIQEECNQEATQVLDPTFLIREHYPKILKNIKRKKQYLLVYHQKYLTDSEEEFIKNFADRNKLEILSINKYTNIANENPLGFGIDEWLGYFKNASYVFTNTFHGTIFSIIFEKPFTVILRDYNSNKITDLINNLGLEHRIYDKDMQENMENPDFDQLMNMDYTLVNKKLEQKIKKSKQYLINHLDYG